MIESYIRLKLMGLFLNYCVKFQKPYDKMLRIRANRNNQKVIRSLKYMIRLVKIAAPF